MDGTKDTITRRPGGGASQPSTSQSPRAPSASPAPRVALPLQPLAASLRRGAMVDGVQQALEEVLKTGKLPPGSRLVEAEIAAALEVSRMPVREALRRLEASGFVQYARNRGFVVTDLVPDVRQIVLIRERLEGLAAHLAAQEITVAELQRLSDLQGRMEQLVAEPDPPMSAFIELNHQFHSTISGASRSPLLMSLIERLNPEGVSNLVIQSFDERGRRQSIEEHRGILDALWRRDSEAAERLAWDHLERGKSDIVAEIHRQQQAEG